MKFIFFKNITNIFNINITMENNFLGIDIGSNLDVAKIIKLQKAYKINYLQIY